MTKKSVVPVRLTARDNCIFDAGLSMSARLVYCALDCHGGWYGKAFPKQITLAAELGVSLRIIERAISELVKGWYVKVIKQGHQAAVYHLLWKKLLEVPSVSPQEFDSNPPPVAGLNSQRENSNPPLMAGLKIQTRQIERSNPPPVAGQEAPHLINEPVANLVNQPATSPGTEEIADAIERVTGERPLAGRLTDRIRVANNEKFNLPIDALERWMGDFSRDYLRKNGEAAGPALIAKVFAEKIGPWINQNRNFVVDCQRQRELSRRWNEWQAAMAKGA